MADAGYGGTLRRRAPKDTKPRPRAKRSKPPEADSLRDQPTADLSSSVRCALCSAEVDPSRMQFHMERCHGVALRSKRLPPP
jgi:hypothetical protein